MTKPFLLPLVILSLLLSGCATSVVAPAERAKIRTIAVVSDLDPEIRVHSMGVLPCLQKEHAGKIDAFSVSEFAENVVAQTLAGRGYQATQVSPEFRAAARDAIQKGFRKEAMDRLEPLAKGCDAVVFIVSQQNQGLYGGETGFGGVEIIPSKIFGMKSILIGCNTGLFIYGTSPLRRIGCDVEARGGCEVRGVEWHDKWEDFSPTDQRKLIEDLRASLENALKPKIEALL